MQQVADDKELLQLMMDDYRSCDPEFRWTNYWSKKCQKLLGFLLTTGLQDFRRNRDPKRSPGSVLSAFGAVDLLPAVSTEDMFSRADMFGQRSGAVPLSQLSVSEVGNPESFRAGDGVYTYSWLNFYIRYAYVHQFFSFGDDCTIVEIGPGSGKQGEMLKKAYPGTTILIFDIPPQLYVSNQYLKTVFPDEVIDYRQTRNITSARQLERGKIHIFPNWKIGIASEIDIDLFWNAASFQEMEPAIVENYLGFVSECSKNIYLMQLMYGQSTAVEQGQGGVLLQTELPHYFEYLRGHEIIDLTRAQLAIPLPIDRYRYSDTFWRKL